MRAPAALSARGVRAGDRVALLAPNHDLLVRAIFACWWIGATACPLSERRGQSLQGHGSRFERSSTMDNLASPFIHTGREGDPVSPSHSAINTMDSDGGR
ncbi:hypothetical protein ASE11_03940 [Hydrogenophaga sp. Root209]|uniref:AMP-binding protein n=1 Tax=unclassified Hydrogenophaga TaxID=2610897 RepID=UPI0006F7D9A5|nr:AMP-binding protein [Hydrogenophaga sp. Root209]KRC04218.1 hypothetical protein ASE11_03940 [Hydrogenophaga sp. Root209]